MILVHIEAGLGNQMMDYAEYYLIKKLNPNQECYVETILYEIPECSSVVSMWNGYELKKIFDIDVPNIKDLFAEEEWNEIIEEVKQSQFWKNNWNYSTAIMEALSNHGISCQIKKPHLYDRVINCIFGVKIHEIMYKVPGIKLFEKKRAQSRYIMGNKGNYYCGHTFPLLKAEADVYDEYNEEIGRLFNFKPIGDERNKQLEALIKDCQSVAIHARRGDLLAYNGNYYNNGYFGRAVSYIKSKVENPVFFVFSDPGSGEWCKENKHLLGLEETDEIYFVDWNLGENSYIDMQLMSICKHNIITNSSFGWWPCYLNRNVDKITCAPSNTFRTSIQL